MTNAEQLFAKATLAFRDGDEAAAESRLREGLAHDPMHTPSLSLLAMIAGRAGRNAEAAALLEQALARLTGDEAVAAELLLAAAYTRGGQPAKAEASYRRVLAASPGSGEAVLRLSALLRGQGRGTEAAALCRDVVASSEDAQVANALGLELAGLGEVAASMAAFERAAALQPGFIEARYNLATTRKAEGRTDDAVALLRKVVADAPGLAAARWALVMAHLPPLYDREAEIDRRRADYAAELDALIAHAERVGPGALAAGVGAAQPFQLAYQGRVDVALQRRYGELVCRAMAAAYPLAPLAARPALSEREGGERVRVGVVCGYIRDHSVWRLPTRGWVAGLDRSKFELIGYHTGGVSDAETDRARALFDRFVQGPLPTAAWCERIAQDRPHALIYPEIGMDPMAAQLAALRLAPVQYASWGHPSTSGYPTIDYFLSSAAMEPADGEGNYSERLVRLPGVSTAVELRPLAEPVPPRAALGLPAGAAVFWCGQTLSKYLPRDDEVLATIAARTPGARFVFIENPDSPPLIERFRRRLAAAFAKEGLDASEHCVFLTRMSPTAFQAAIGCADVVLDSLGWSGCNSLLDSLAHALPIVTLPGPTMRSRHGLAILAQLGLERLSCESKADYIEMAVRLAGDAGERAAIGAEIRAALAMLDDARPVAALGRHILAACTPD